jgi:hypothetical protein
MSTETALPEATDPVAVASDQPADTPADTTSEAAGTEDKPAEPKPEKHPLEKVLAKEQRRNQALARRVHAAEHALAQYGALQKPAIGDTNQPDSAANEVLSLPKAQLEKLIEDRAREMAPKIKDQAAEKERQIAAVSAVQKELGERFLELTDDLASVFPPEKQMAVLRSDAPAALIEYLTDPDNADEADRIAGMDAYDAGRALARIEFKMQAAKASEKPQRSSAKAPIESMKPTGATTNGAPDPRNTKAWIKWANEQEARSH